KAATTPTPESGELDGVDYFFGCHLGETATQGCIAFAGNVFVDILGIDDTAIAQSDTELLLVEVHVHRFGNPLLRFGMDVTESLNLALVHKMLVDKFTCIVGVDLHV